MKGLCEVRLIMVMGLAVVAAGCGRKAQDSLVEQADRFFALLRAGQVAEAHAMLADESRQVTSLEDFQQAVDAYGFTDHQRVAWESPHIDGDYGNLKGVLIARDGMALPQELVFFRQHGKWQLHIVREPSDMAALESVVEARRNQPAPEGINRLAMGTINRLVDSLLDGDYAAFHRETATTLREQTTPDVFEESFAWMASPEVGFDWAAARDVMPVFTVPAEVNPEGILAVAGHVPVGDQQLVFAFEYVYEASDWLLISINIRPPL